MKEEQDKSNTSRKKVIELGDRDNNDPHKNSQAPGLPNEADSELQIELLKDNRILRWEKLQYVLIPFLIMALLSLLRESPLITKYIYIIIIIYIK